MLVGNAPNQIALAAKAAQKFDVAGIVVESKKGKPIKKLNLYQLFEKVLDRSVFLSIRKSWDTLQNYYSTTYNHFPETRLLHTNNINHGEVVKFIETIKPDLIMVSGTRIVKAPIIDLAPALGIVNLHTGLSPYVKGGPNCTNWCLAKDNFHLVGNTVMWLDKGIDSGNIISSEVVQFEGKETLKEIHFKVMESAHDLYLKCVDYIRLDVKKCPSVRQSEITEGELFYTKQWNYKWKFRLLKNLAFGRFRRRVKEQEYMDKISELRTIGLPG